MQRPLGDTLLSAVGAAVPELRSSPWRLAVQGANIVPTSGRCQLMVTIGDRIRLSSTKGPNREGVVTAVTGSLVRLRWPSGEETTVVPAPGTLTVLTAGGAAAQRAAKKKSAVKGEAGASKKTAGKGATSQRRATKRAKGS